MRSLSLGVLLAVSLGACLPAQAGPPLTVASFNIRYGKARERDAQDNWPNRREHVVTTIRDWNPHVVGVQEALRFQVEFLEQRLEGFRRVGQGRDGGEKGEYVAIFFDRERLELIESGDFWLSETPEVTASVGWDAALTRMCTWAVFEDKLVPGSRFKVWNTHFDHRGAEARLRSAELIAARVGKSDLPDIVLGDLNATETSKPLDALRAAGLSDTFRTVLPDAWGNTWNGFRIPDPEAERTGGRKIDYVLIDDGFAATSARIDRRQFGGRDDRRLPSDHYPVLAELVLLPAERAELVDLRDRKRLASRLPLLIAHRGGVVEEDSPECSAEAIRRAARDDYAMVELDVHRSKDGAAIVFHDGDLKEACGIEARVADLRADELVDIRYSGSDQTILTFDAALRLCSQLGLGVMVDLKAGRNDRTFVTAVETAVRRHGLEHAAVSFSTSSATRELWSAIRLTATRSERQSLRDGQSLDLKHRIWFGLPWNLDTADILPMQEAGVLVFPAINTFRYPDDPDGARAQRDIDRLLEAGVDGFQIDSVYAPRFRR